MFDSLSERLSNTFKKLTGGGVLSQAQVDEAVKEIRRALLEADVHFKVARDVCARIAERAVGQKVWESLKPGQQVVQIFNDELVNLLGGKEQTPPDFAGQAPVVVLLAGLQGSGKTTFASKLALYLKKKLRKNVGLIPADCQRPAAKTQLQVLGERVGVPVFDSPLEKGAVQVAKLGVEWAKSQFFDVVIIDTAGRQQVEESLMSEIAAVNEATQPKHKLLVIDAMIGSQGLDVAKVFQDRLGLTGLVLTKLDGDARGGVALSAREVTGVPISFAGVGEKPEDLEPFYADRMAGRILGMGDVMALVEKARENISEEDAMDSASKMMSGRFTLEDFLKQMKMIRSMGPLEGLMKMIPGMGQAMTAAKGVDAEKEMRKVEAIIHSMTKQERSNPDLLNGRRRMRIAQGSGTQVADINRFLKQFTEMQKMMKQFSKMGALKSLLKGGRGGGGLGLM